MAEIGPRSMLALVGRAVRFELRLYRSLLRWTARRPDVPKAPDAEALGYAQSVTPVMCLWIFASATELVVLHLLIPWHTVRIVADVVSAWGLVWMLGLLASLRVYPHLLTDAALRVRYGASTDITVAWDSIADIRVQRRDLPSSARTLQPIEGDTGTDLRVGVSGQVNVQAVLRRPLTVPTPKGNMRIAALSFWADDPRRLVARARPHMTKQPEVANRRTAHDRLR